MRPPLQGGRRAPLNRREAPRRDPHASALGGSKAATTCAAHLRSRPTRATCTTRTTVTTPSPPSYEGRSNPRQIVEQLPEGRRQRLRVESRGQGCRHHLLAAGCDTGEPAGLFVEVTRRPSRLTSEGREASTQPETVEDTSDPVRSECSHELVLEVSVAELEAPPRQIVDRRHVALELPQGAHEEGALLDVAHAQHPRARRRAGGVEEMPPHVGRATHVDESHSGIAQCQTGPVRRGLHGSHVTRALEQHPRGWLSPHCSTRRRQRIPLEAAWSFSAASPHSATDVVVCDVSAPRLAPLRDVGEGSGTRVDISPRRGVVLGGA